MALPISSANTIKIVTKSGFLTGSVLPRMTSGGLVLSGAACPATPLVGKTGVGGVIFVAHASAAGH
ncbi:MAG: hypothetical protein M3120_06110 [Pseudomonadota bacterium]|nr:hypothetical protein [Pseudomonadota bacterium]